MTKLKTKKTNTLPANDLTPIRKKVLHIIRGYNRPIGAYALLDEYKKDHPNAAPPTIYRALEYLMDQHLIHKIEKLNAYVACGHDHNHGNHTEAVQILVCTKCGKTRETDATELNKSTAKLAKKLGFVVEQSILEVIGHCKNCQSS
ncbi:MAG: transcriptional repressor [Alphaproteobacteria bacterium]|nr:MAG: transcriptional repressor [Alphaproteobacteria bacterium]